MRTTTYPFKLREWRTRMGWTQRQAAEAVGLSLGAYRSAEYRAEDRPGSPVQATLVLLCRLLERHRTEIAA